jgi:ElaB/YqjD/DUF883 family membrane-anchored ribosome-binding protein
VSKASDELEEKTEGDVPAADEVVAATAKEVSEITETQHARFDAAIRRDPLRSIAIAAGVGFLAAILARRS